MRRLDGLRSAVAALLAAAALAAPACAEDAAYRYSAPIELQQDAPFVQLPLPASAYGRSLRTDLQDLRIVDSRGERVPFAVLAPRAGRPQMTKQQRDAQLYALPARPAAGAAWPSPVEVTVEGERISVKRRHGPGEGASTDAGAAPGWLFDLGEREPRDPPPRQLRLQWSGPAVFSATFDLETSDDLRQWRPAGSGQVMALASAAGPLTQPGIMLPESPTRFVRLVWADAGTAPALTGATVVAEQRQSVALDAPTLLVLSPGAEPAGKASSAEDARRALHFDLGGVLPLVQLDLQLPPGTRVVPVRVQARASADEAWRELAQAVFYRLERGAAVSASPALSLQATVRYLRVIPDERAAALDATQTRLAVQAQLASLVFAAQGQPPFSLLAGAGKAQGSALPIGTLVPALDDERPRFGKAALGAWSEVEVVARRAESAQRLARMRPWLLWAVLLAGVAGLGFMVWRLLRSAKQA